MKTNRILLLIATVSVSAFLTTSIFAWGNGNTQSQGMGKGKNSTQGQIVKPSTREKSLSGIALSPLSEQEKLDLAYQYSEEMVARDLYNHFYDLYEVATFKNIANSENQHMEAVKVLLQRYSLPIPTNYGELQDEFDALKTEGEKGLQNALEVGLKTEILDINDILDTIKTTDNEDIRIIFSNIGGASYQHMRGFAKSILNNGFTSSVNYSDYLSMDEVNSNGNLKNKLVEELSSQGVILTNEIHSKTNNKMNKGGKKGQQTSKKMMNRQGNGQK